MKTKELTKLKPGDKAIVVEVNCQRILRKRVFELGVVPGVKVEMIRKAPLGDPVEFRIRSCNLSLRKEDAKCIIVRTDIGKELMPLSMLAEGEIAKIEIIEVDEDEGRDELMEKGVSVGARVKIISDYPESKVIIIGKKKIIVPKSVCGKIFVRLAKK